MDKVLLFKEEFNWDERKLNEGDEEVKSNLFYKGVTVGIGSSMLFLLALSIIQLF